jgi:hypothetical protein
MLEDRVYAGATGEKVAYQTSRFRTIRSRYVHIDVPPVPLGQVVLFDAQTIQLAVGFDGTGSVPTLPPDVFEHMGRCVPGIEMGVNNYFWRDQLAARLQHLPRQAILADEMQSFVG